jgi:hypothetical protein
MGGSAIAAVFIRHGNQKALPVPNVEAHYFIECGITSRSAASSFSVSLSTASGNR